ncbi:MAG: HAMP domain-containing protein [Sandaracinaceae bacterium]|nr:HAMP domain-containing protein [Sandaracinaceae bacterium]
MTRLERTLLAALLVAGLSPLLAATFFGRSALRDAYSRGVNPVVEEQLAAAVESHREHIVALREAADSTADAITQHWQLHDALRNNDLEAVRRYAQAALGAYPQVAAVRVYRADLDSDAAPGGLSDDDIAATDLDDLDDLDDPTLDETLSDEDGAHDIAPPDDAASDDGPSAPDGGDVDDEADGRTADDALDAADEGGPPLVEVSIAARADPEQVRSLTRERVLDTIEPPARVVVVVTSPRAVFADLQRAGEVTGLYSRLLEQTDYVSDVYVWVLAAYVAFVIALALLVSIWLARRVSKRVLALADATVRVGQGDLAVSVPDDDDDEIGELTRAFNRMVQDLRESRERIDYLKRISAWQDFARRLAHEIKNPLTPIQLAAQEVAQAYRGDDPRFAAMLEDARGIIEEEVATLRRLVGEFSSFARLPEVDLAEADLVELLRDLERGFPSVLQDVYGEAASAESRVTLRLDVPASPVLASVDAMMLKRCLDNLVRNAVEAIAGEARAGSGAVTLQLVRGTHQLELSVTDDGPGIEANARTRVFDPYFTTKSSGTGLGLAIVKKVVLEHRGRIVCERGEGPAERPGTRFVISMPLG